jgi:hypothetical protein
MSRRMRRLLAAVLAVGVVLVAGGAAAAPGPRLKQFRVPTADSQPRDITNGSDGNRWFTEGTEFTNAPGKIARITPAGDVTEFAPDVADGCNVCILTDIAQGPRQPALRDVQRLDLDPVQRGHRGLRVPRADAQQQRRRRQSGHPGRRRLDHRLQQRRRLALHHLHRPVHLVPRHRPVRRGRRRGRQRLVHRTRRTLMLPAPATSAASTPSPVR